MLLGQWQEDLTLVALSQLRKALIFRKSITGAEARIACWTLTGGLSQSSMEAVDSSQFVSTKEIVSIESRCVRVNAAGMSGGGYHLLLIGHDRAACLHGISGRSDVRLPHGGSGLTDPTLERSALFVRVFARSTRNMGTSEDLDDRRACVPVNSLAR